MKIRLQGGPFDGDREPNVQPGDLPGGELPERIYVTKCWNCGTHWYVEPVKNGETYRQDELDKNGWLVYVWVDPGAELRGIPGEMQ